MYHSRIAWNSGAIILLFLILSICPVYAGDKYSSGEPVLSAGIIGSNELIIGEKSNITVSISNSGLIDMKFVESGAITPDYLPTTALGLSALMEKGDTPVEIQSGSQIIGDLDSGKVTTNKYIVTVPQSASAGSYNLPLNLSYQCMYMATQTGEDEIDYSFKDKETTIYIPIKIRPAASLNINSVDSGDLNVGGEGHIIVSVTNSGSDNAKDAVFFIQPVGTSPIVPFQDGVYAGDMAQGAETSLTFKVSVSTDADPSIQYPMKMWAEYTDYQGLPAQTDKVDLSAGFKPKVMFSLVNSSSSVASGQKGDISVQYKNTGPITVYNAQAEISIVDPFTSEDDQAYLGTMYPGDIKTAMFKLDVNSGTTPKQYALDSEIRYNDINLTEYVSDPVKVPVDVTASSSDNWLLPGLILVIIIIGGGFFYYRRTRQ